MLMLGCKRIKSLHLDIYLLSDTSSTLNGAKPKYKETSILDILGSFNSNSSSHYILLSQ